MKLSSLILALFLAFLAHPCLAEDPPEFLLQWGSFGSGAGQFQSPNGISVSSDGDIYVSDILASRLTRFTLSGQYICDVGTFGPGDGQFNGCWDSAVGPDGLVYVTDNQNFRFQVFDNSCDYVRQWTVPGYSPAHTAIDPQLGRIYTTAGHYVLMFDTTGTYLGQWPFSDDVFPGRPAFSVGPSGLLYFPDGARAKVNVFTSDGTLVRTWGEFGAGAGQLDSPGPLATDGNENVYVIDRYFRIQKFTSTGQFLTAWGSQGSGPGQFSDNIEDMCVDASGNVFVLDTGHYQVIKFGYAPTPTHRHTWGALKQLYREK